MRFAVCLALQFMVTLLCLGQSAEDNSLIASCTFPDGNEVSVRYAPVSTKQKPPIGKPWAPGGTPIYLFTQTELTANNASLPVGAYSIYVLPAKQSWTLIVNKNVSGKEYDEKQDVIRMNMQSGSLTEPVDPLQVSFAHVAPKECNIRIYYGKTGNWAEFKQK